MKGKFTPNKIVGAAATVANADAQAVKDRTATSPPRSAAKSGRPDQSDTDVVRTMTFVKPGVDVVSFRGTPQLDWRLLE